jgi:hypothetical protein
MPSKNGQSITKKDLVDVVDALKDYIGVAFSKLNAKIDGVESSLIKKIDGVESGLNKKIDGVASGMNKKIDGVESSLRFDIKDIKRDLKEVDRKVDVLQDSVVALDEKVRFQQDFPERLVQAEKDIYALKLKTYRLEDGK